MKLGAFILFVLMVTASSTTIAVEAVREFDSPQQEAQYNRLIEELRCLMCQHQSLAESPVESARDLRDRTYELVRQGKSDKEIVDYMVTRFGDFVVFRPPFKATTLLLWTGPAIILLVAAGGFILYSRYRRRMPAREMGAEDQQRIRELLED